MLESFIDLFLRNWPVVVLLVLIAHLVRNHYKHGLQKYPGPFLASLTDWWRFFDVLGRRPDITHNQLHRKHGDIVRLGPNTLSFADPQALKTIYGLNKGFVKVSRARPRTDESKSDCSSVWVLPGATGRSQRRPPALPLLNHRREVSRRTPQMRQWCFLHERPRSVRTIRKRSYREVSGPNRRFIRVKECHL